MHKKINHTELEKKWQKYWLESDIYRTVGDSDKPKAYVLDMFPYPSGEGLHVGHPKGYIATDIYSRFKKMSGFEVLHPMGWDAFGLPAENFAIKNRVHPRVAVKKNIANFKLQLGELGFNYDWTREINTTDPGYYKWTQWIFLKLLEKGLAYQSWEPINWCPGCQTGLANEDLESDGTCERCGSVVEKKPMRQWILKITAYADRMLKDLDLLSWPPHIKEAQRNWIGRSEGAEIDFTLKFTLPDKHADWRDANAEPDRVTVFTTRPDTLYGATYLVLSPEHKWVRVILEARSEDILTNRNEVSAYVEAAGKKNEIERTDATKEKTGVELKGVVAINPANGTEIPVYVADYVLAGYGTGAIMGVPAHDERDGAFAQKYDVPVIQVVRPVFGEPLQGSEERYAVTAFVHDPETDKYLFIKSHEFKEISKVYGGIKQGEMAPAAAIREVLEETGYKTMFRNFLGGEVESNFYHPGKKINRKLITQCVLLQLLDKTPVGISADERQKQEPVWLTLKEFERMITSERERFDLNLTLHEKLFTGDGVLINSGDMNGVRTEEAKKKIVSQVGGRAVATYKIKDWVFSRQRYWGEPIPVIHCEKCGIVPVPYDQLPVALPEVEEYAPTGTGESPLADIAEWVNVDCPTCGGKGKRETNTMPQWAGSSWYYLRFIDPTNAEALIDPNKEKKWSPVDVYVGGDHAVRHLIYARFWHKFLYDIGVVTSLEPFTRLEFLGFILAEDGRKMSKRWGNIINPSDIVKRNGADTLRVYEMFMGPFENTIAWSTDGLVGAQRFLERVYGLSAHVQDESSEEVNFLLHKTIQKVSNDIEAFKFNTAISALMIFINLAEKQGLTKEAYRSFLRLLAPFAPHLSEELWSESGVQGSIHTSEWPVHDTELLKQEEVVIGVQFGGRTRGSVTVPQGSSEALVLEMLGKQSNLKRYLDEAGESPKIIFVKDKIINVLPGK